MVHKYSSPCSHLREDYMSHLHKILTSYKLNTHQRNTYFEVLTNTCTVYPLAYEKHEPKMDIV